MQDMADSRRINANIRDEEQKLPEQEKPPFSLEATILSSEFWPPLKEEKLELPGQIKEAMEAYTKKYEKQKVGESSVCRKLSHGPLPQLAANHEGGLLFLLPVQPSSLLGFGCSFLAIFLSLRPGHPAHVRNRHVAGPPARSFRSFSWVILILPGGFFTGHEDLELEASPGLGEPGGGVGGPYALPVCVAGARGYRPALPGQK